MQIAKIVGSESHIKYIARVIDTLDVNCPPQADDYSLGQFVSIKINKVNIVGVISNTQLINPDFLGLRLSSEENNQLFSPDYLHQQGIMIEIIILGWLENNVGVHKAPLQVLPAQSIVSLLEKEKVQAFHHDSQGKLSIGYYTELVRVGGLMGNALLNIVIETLQGFASVDEQKKLALLKKNLNWQQTLSVFNYR